MKVKQSKKTKKLHKDFVLCLAHKTKPQQFSQEWRVVDCDLTQLWQGTELLLVQVTAGHTQCWTFRVKWSDEVYHWGAHPWTFRVKWSDEVYHWGAHPHSADIQGQMEWWSLSLRCTPTQCGHSGSNGVMKSITEVRTHTVRTFRVKWSDKVFHTLTQSLAFDSVSDNCLKYLRSDGK